MSVLAAERKAALDQYESELNSMIQPSSYHHHHHHRGAGGGNFSNRLGTAEPKQLVDSDSLHSLPLTNMHLRIQSLQLSPVLRFVQQYLHQVFAGHPMVTERDSEFPQFCILVLDHLIKDWSHHLQFFCRRLSSQCLWF